MTMTTLNRTRTALITIALALITITSSAFANVQIDARIQINPVPRDLQVWIWPDRGEGATYFPGETIYMNVEASRDCFLILYNIDTRGHLRILFPYDPWDDNFVRAGEVVTFPRSWDPYSWTVDGPEGTEYVQAIASEFPISPPEWPVYLGYSPNPGRVSYDRDLRDFRSGADRFDYIRVVNRKITGRYWDWCATDLASFYVRRHYPRPVNVHVGVRFDPWPDIYYGEIFIAWPIGGRIYIDGVYVGVAPLCIPRRYYRTTHVITCYDGPRLVRTQKIKYYPKRDFRYHHDAYRTVDVFKHGNVKSARRGGIDVYRSETRSGKTSRGTDKVIIRDRSRGDDDRDDRHNKRSGNRGVWQNHDDEDDERGRSGRRDDFISTPATKPKPVVVNKPVAESKGTAPGKGGMQARTVSTSRTEAATQKPQKVVVPDDGAGKTVIGKRDPGAEQPSPATVAKPAKSAKPLAKSKTDGSKDGANPKVKAEKSAKTVKERAGIN